MNATTLPAASTRCSALGRLLVVDAAVCAGAGVVLAFAAGPLSDQLGLAETLLRVVGIGLLPYAVLLAWIGRQSPVPQSTAWAVVLLNIGWAAASVLLLATGALDPTSAGRVFVLAQALAVAALAALETWTLRRMNRP
jgi:hypothetical protein